jgi:hypothetical protein
VEKVYSHEVKEKTAMSPVTDKKLNLEQIFAAAIKQSAGEKLVISPKTVANIAQNSKIQMKLDEEGNFVLTVRENHE